MSELSDEVLIKRAQAGDEEAVAALYRRHVQSIARYVGYRVSDMTVVEDLTAEVFLQMVEGLPRYTVTGAPFEAWLYRIAAARVADHYRHRERYQQEQLDERINSDGTSLEGSLQQREEFQELRAALAALNEEYRTILILRFVERKSHREVAKIMDKSVRAVATAQHRALKRLAELLGTDKAGRHYLRGNKRE